MCIEALSVPINSILLPLIKTPYLMLLYIGWLLIKLPYLAIRTYQNLIYKNRNLQFLQITIIGLKKLNNCSLKLLLFPSAQFSAGLLYISIIIPHYYGYYRISLSNNCLFVTFRHILFSCKRMLNNQFSYRFNFYSID